MARRGGKGAADVEGWQAGNAGGVDDVVAAVWGEAECGVKAWTE